jgi:hypothetical protein
MPTPETAPTLHLDHRHRVSRDWSGRRWVLYTLEFCETCGACVQGANGMGMDEVDACTLIAHGVQHREDLPGEGWHDDETGLEVCEVCATP